MRLIEQLRWWASECDRTNFGCQARNLLIEAAEALEKAEPVRHGRWELILDDFDCELMRCSCCDEEFYDGDNDTVDQTPNYCPNCGAKMDGE